MLVPRSRRKRDSLSFVTVVPIALLVLCQGGFMPLAVCAVGCAVCLLAGVLWLRAPLTRRNVPVVTLLCALLAICYLASSLVNGPSLTTFAETGSWSACAGLSLLAATQTRTQRESALKLICWFGVATAFASFLTYTGVLPLVDGFVAGRLQFTFQYANSAAAWYAVCSLLCLLSPDESLRPMAPLPLAALLLTMSAGAIAVFVAVIVVVSVRCIRCADWDAVCSTLRWGLLAVLFFVLIRYAPEPVALLGVAVAFALHLAFSDVAQGLVARVGARRATFAAVLTFVLAAVAMGVLLQDRLVAASASWGERALQMRDGVTLWLAKPVLGVGPNNWQYLYPYVQTAPYDANVVHSSIVQALVDAGVLGLVVMVAMAAVGVRDLLRRLRAHVPWSDAAFFAALFLILHSLVEFDLQFASLAMLLLLLLTDPEGTGVSLPGLLAGLAGMLLCLPLCGLGSYSAWSQEVMRGQVVTGDNAGARQTFVRSRLARMDVGAQGLYLKACYQAGDFQAVCDVYRQMRAPSYEDTGLAAMAYHELGDTYRQTEVLVQSLEAQPHNQNLAKTAAYVRDAYGADPALARRLDEAIETTGR